MTHAHLLEQVLRGKAADLTGDELLRIRGAIDAELTRRRRVPPLRLDEVGGRPLVELLDDLTGGQPPGLRLVTFMETWADEATLLDREPTAREVGEQLGLSKATIDRRMRTFRDVLGTGQTPTRIVHELRSQWHGPLRTVPVRLRTDS